jgi:hypothetical protein
MPNDDLEAKKGERSGFANLSELLNHLDAHGGNAAVVVALEPPKDQPAPSSSETKRLASELMTRAEEATGLKVEASNVFPNLGRFVLKAPAELIRNIAAQPEVADTTPNEIRGGLVG